MAFIPAALAVVGPMLASAGTAVAGATAAAGVTAAGASAAGMGASILSAAGTATSALAAFQAANYNANVADLQARQSNEQGALAASEAIRRSRQVQASANAAAGANGFERTGSIRDLLQQAARSGYSDYLTAAYEGEVGAVSRRNDATLDRQQGKNALVSGAVGAGSDILGGAGRFYRNREALANG